VARASKTDRDRIAELEDEIKQRDRRIAELRADLDRAEQLVTEEREHVGDADSLIDSWIEAFEMVLTDNGWSYAEWVDQCVAMHDKYRALLGEWNRNVALFNNTVARRNVGRPLAASEAQVAQVRKLHKAGTSLRAIVAATSLGLRTVRTIVDEGYGRDRTTVKHLERIDPERKLEASWRARQRTRDALPKRIGETLAKGRALVQAAKGLK
jgi:hypothetical protein